MDIALKTPGEAKPLHLRKDFTVADRIRSGDTVPLLGTTLKLGSEKSALDADLLLFLTPTLRTDRPEPDQNPVGKAPEPKP